MIPSRGESIEFDTLIIFPLVLQVKKFQNLGKSMSKSGLRGGSPCLPLTLIRLAGLIGIQGIGEAEAEKTAKLGVRLWDPYWGSGSDDNGREGPPKHQILTPFSIDIRGPRHPKPLGKDSPY